MDGCIPDLLVLGAVDSMMSLVSCSSYQNTTALNFPSLQASRLPWLSGQSHLQDHRCSGRGTQVPVKAGARAEGGGEGDLQERDHVVSCACWHPQVVMKSVKEVMQ